MELAVMLVITLSACLLAYGVLRGMIWCRTPSELRGDWWARFERQFRAYVSTVQLDGECSGPERRQRPG